MNANAEGAVITQWQCPDMADAYVAIVVINLDVLFVVTTTKRCEKCDGTLFLRRYRYSTKDFKWRMFPKKIWVHRGKCNGE